MKINYVCPLNNPSGYASAARNYIRALREEGVEIILNELNYDQIQYVEDKEYFNKLRGKFDPNIPCLFHQVPEAKTNMIKRGLWSNKQNISMFVWEADIVPQLWVSHINHDYDACITPTHFGISQFKKSGIKTPVYLAHHGVNTKTFKPLKTTPKDNKFRFLSVFQISERKGYKQLVKAFIEEFKDDNVELLLKTYRFNNHPDEYKAVVRMIQKVAFDCNHGKTTPKIKIVAGFLSPPNLNLLYNSCDAFVLPTRCEGWGLPFSEAACVGLPIIGTDWGGHQEFLNENNSYMIKNKEFVSTDMEELQNYFPWYNLMYGMRWADPCVDHLKEQMRYVFENYEEAMQKAKKCHDNIKTFTWKKGAKQIINALEQLGV